MKRKTNICRTTLLVLPVVLGCARLSAETLYSFDLYSSSIHGFLIDQNTGALTYQSSASVVDGLHDMAVDPFGRYLYVTIDSFSVGSEIVGYRINGSDGSLNPLTGSPFPSPSSSPEEIAVDPRERFVYVSNGSDQTVSGYTLHRRSGALTSLPGSPFPAGGTGFFAQVQVDPTGRFLYAAGLVQFRINEATGEPTATGLTASAPYGFALDPTGRFLYLETAQGLVAYSINLGTGAITPVPGSPIGPPGSNVTSLAVDPSGSFVFIGSSSSNATYFVSGYAIDKHTGVLSPLPGGPTQLQAPSASITLETYGRFMYVGEFNNQIEAFSINAATGVLTNVPGSPFAVLPFVVIAPEPFAGHDTASPLVILNGVITGPTTQVLLGSYDWQSGLASVLVTKCTNCTAVTDDFTAGTRAVVVTTATKTDPAKISSIQIKSTDLAGNPTVFDAVDVRVEAEGKPQIDEVVVSEREHTVEITNGNPGVRNLVLEAHGVRFPVLGLKSDETRILDITAALQPGPCNEVRILSDGKSGATISVVFTER